jgi:hypothetical protein
MSEDDYLHGVDVGIDLYIDRARKAEATSASRFALLRRAYRMLERCGGELPSIFERHDTELMNELDEELGDD